MQMVVEEIKNILKSRWKVVLLLVMPPLITLYFCILFQDGIIEHAHTVIVDQDQSSLSRSLVQEFKVNRGFDIVGSFPDVPSAVSLVEREDADIVLVLPPGFSTDIKKGKSSQVTVIADAGNMAISSNALKRASEIILTFNAGTQIQVLEGKGYTKTQAENLALPVKFSYRQLNNPSGGFLDFLLWGLIGAIGHFPIILFAAAALKEKDTMRPAHLVVGSKLFAYSLLGSVEMLFSIFLAVAFFPLSYHGTVFALVFLVVVFVLTITAMGLFLSALMPNPVMASQGAVVVALPALLLSGHTWPMSGFPWFVKFLGLAEPLTYLIEPLRELALTGETGTFYWHNISVLACMLLGYIAAALLIYRKKVSLCKEKAFLN